MTSIASAHGMIVELKKTTPTAGEIRFIFIHIPLRILNLH
jgi:hypothetical protein